MAGSITSATQSLSSILRQTTLDDHEEVLKAANAVLKKSKNDLDAQHVKVVALVKLDRFEDALRVLEDGGDRLKERAQLERAYALYKSGSWEEAARVFRGGDGTRAMLHVQAQTLYRLEDFPTAADIYKSLSTSSGGIENEVNDLRINSSATDAQLFWTGQGQLAEHKKTDREDLEAFETAYNAACRSIARGELAQGEMLLRRAKDLCSALDELSEEDKKAELLPIIVQQIYVLSRLSKSDEASRLALDIKVAEISDLSTQKVAQSNIISTELRPENPFIAHRSFNSTTNIPKSDKLFQFQDRILQRNAYALDLLALKYSGVSKSTSKIISEIPAPTTDPDTNLLAVFNAAAHAQGQTGKAGLKETLALLSKRPNDVGLILTVIQLYILTNNHGSAIALLEGFFKRLEASTSSSDLDVRFAPGLVAVVVSLYRLQGRKTHIKQELVKAASYWRRKSKANPDLLRAAGTALLDSDERADLEEAGAIFSELRAQDPTNRFLTAGYVASVATIDSSKCVNEITQLTPVSRLIAGLDAAALEEGGIHLPPAASKQDSSKKRSAEGLGKPAKKRIRKSRLPKNLDSSKPADPERWLPLRERSTFRPKGKKGKGRAGGAQATQGGFTDKVEESLELAGGEGKVKVQTVANGGAGKGKKKKGKR